jgi:hypothetical protein
MKKATLWLILSTLLILGATSTSANFGGPEPVPTCAPKQCKV